MKYVNCTFKLNRDLVFTYHDQGFRDLLELNNKFDLLGKKNHEIPHAVSEQSEQFERHDLLVMEQGKMISGLTIDTFNGELKFLYSRISPTYSGNNIVGVEVALNQVPIYKPKNIILTKLPTHMVFQRPSTIFTEKEYEILFLYYAGFTRTEISKLIKLSISAVSARLESCYNKTSTTSLSQLLEYYHNTGLKSYLPEIFRKKGHIIL